MPFNGPDPSARLSSNFGRDRRAPMDEELLLPRDLIGAVVSKVGTAKQLCTILQLCKSWRSALTGQELEAIWERWVRREYPRAVAILDLTTPNVTMTSWRDVYRGQFRAEAANAVNFTNALAPTDRLDSYVFTVEVRLDGELKASWMDKGPKIRIDEFTTERGCILGGRARLWTSPPVWYSEVVQQPNQFNLPIGWDGRLELTLFVSRNTAQGLRTGKLFQTRNTTIDDEDTNFYSGQPVWGELCYQISPIMFCGGGRIPTGCIHLDIIDVNGDAEEKEPVGSALARMIGKALGYL
eukprot:scaffold88061_cov60-Phaeocystis_antarctica.AAC.4